MRRITRRGWLTAAATIPAAAVLSDHPGVAAADTPTSVPGLVVDTYLPTDPSVDCSTGFQDALNAASSIGANVGAKCPLHCTPGRNYLISSLIPMSYVDLRCHGSAFQRNTNYTTNHPIFYGDASQGVGTPITQFAVRGATLTGTRTESEFQGFLLIAQGSFLEIKDCCVKDTTGNGIYLADCQHVWVERNKLINVAAIPGGVNVINFVNRWNGAATPLQHIWCDRNLILQARNLGISVGSSNGANRTDSLVDAHITNNTVETIAVANPGWPIGIEQGGNAAPPNLKRFDISGNTCVQNGTSGSLYGICLTNDSRPLTTDSLCISEVTITGNRVVSSGAGILDEASISSVTGNTINAATDDIVLTGAGRSTISHITISGNAGHLGSGKPVRVLGGVDKTTCSISP